MMSKYFLSLFSLCLSAFLTVSTAYPQTSAPTSSALPAQALSAQATSAQAKTENGLLIDGIVATVGDEVILFSDLQRAVKHASNNQMTIEAGAKLKGEGTEKDVGVILDQLIDQRVLAVRIREMGLNMSDDELNVEIQNFLKNQGVTEERFNEILAQEGETKEAYREEFKRQIETQRFVGRTIRSLVSVTDDEVKNYYLQQSGGKQQGVRKIKLRSIVLATPSDASKETKAKKDETIKKIKDELAAGKKFEDLAKSYSEDTQAAKNGGLLAPKIASELPPPVRDSLKDVKEGSVLGPFIFAGSTFFFQYVGVDVSENGDFLSQKSALESRLMETKFQERLSEYVKSERSKVKIEKFDLKIIK